MTMNQQMLGLSIFILMIYYTESIYTSKSILNIHQKIEDYLILNQIYFSQYEQNIAYVSAKWKDNTLSTKKYDLSTNQPQLLETYLYQTQNVAYDKILQIGNQYIMLYQMGNKFFQLFYSNSTLAVHLSNFSSSIQNVLYSDSRKEIYLAKTNGKINCFDLTDILISNFNNMHPLTNVSGISIISLSYDQKMLVITALNNSQIILFDLYTRLVITSLTKNFSVTLPAIWSNDNSFFTLLDTTNFILVQYSVISPYIKKSLAISLRFNNTYQIKSFYYLQQVSHFMIIAYNQIIVDQMYTVFYDINTAISTISSINVNATCLKTSLKRFYNGEQYYFLYYSTDNGYISTIKNRQMIDLSTNEESAIKFIENTLLNKIIKTFNLVPGSRIVFKPVFLFFVNFDDVQLYNYHSRQHDYVVQGFFKNIQQLQTQKWAFIPFQTIWGQWFGLNITLIKQFLDKKAQWTTNKFNSIQGNGNGFLLNTLDFFTSNIFLILIMYLIIKLSFHILFKYKISLIIRKYSFYILIPIIILQGNIQYMIYLFAFEMKTLFYHQFSSKLIIILTFSICFMVIFCGITTFWMIKYINQKKQKYFLQNLKYSNVKQIIFMTLQFAIKNIIFGFLHFFIPNHDNYQNLHYLITFETANLIINVILINKIINQCFFKQKLRKWTHILASFIRIIIIMILIFSIQRDNDNTSITQNQNITHFSSININLFSYYIGLMLFSIFYEILNTFLQIKLLFKNQNIWFCYNQDKLEEIFNPLDNQTQQKLQQIKIVQFGNQNIENQSLCSKWLQHNGQDFIYKSSFYNELKDLYAQNKVLKKITIRNPTKHVFQYSKTIVIEKTLNLGEKLQNKILNKQKSKHMQKILQIENL